jgi:hypothetical protein
MPLLDHFHEPILSAQRWPGFHAVWPTMLILRLNQHLPEHYKAEPRVQLGTAYEIDIGTSDRHPTESNGHPHADGGGVGTLAAPVATVEVATELDQPDEFGVRVYSNGGVLVAAVELVSPSNKDRPESRRAFAEKVAE